VYQDVQSEKEKSDKKINKRLKEFESEFSPKKVSEREEEDRSLRKKDMKQTLVWDKTFANIKLFIIKNLISKK
jgi:hypothetical protein